MTALAMRQKGLKPPTKIVLYWLADHHNSETGDCFPRIKILAKECEMDRSTVLRHLDILEDAGLIRRVQRRRENGSQASNSYVLMFTESQNATPPVAKCDPSPVAKCDPSNLGSNNLGTPTGAAPSFGGDLFGQVDPSPDPKKKVRLPEGWVPGETDLAYAREKGLNDSEIKEMADEFRGYWIERKDAKAKRSADGWRRTWQGWVRRDAPTFIRNRRAHGRPSRPGDATTDAFAAVAARMSGRAE